MQLKNITNKLNGRYWLIAGVLTYLGTALYSIIRSVDPTLSIGENLFVAIDWFAACIVYFFLGALLGLIIDIIIARVKHRKIPNHSWVWLTLAIWIIGSIYIGLNARPDLLHPALIIFFPWAFGVFFTGSAFVILAPKSIEHTFYGKLVFDIIYIAIFAAWFWYETHREASTTVIRRTLLYILFAVITLGFVSCVNLFS
jgi:hypothetical protein